MELVFVVLALIVVDVAAYLWGADSRPRFHDRRRWWPATPRCRRPESCGLS